MERVETLLQKLQQQLRDGASASQMLLTVQILEHELLAVQKSHPPVQEMVSVTLPSYTVEKTDIPAVRTEATEMAVKPEEAVPEEKMPVMQNEDTEEKIIQVLQVDEAEIEAELEEIKKNAANIQKISVQSKPQLLFESIDDEAPTLRHRTPPPVKKVIAKEINEAAAAKTIDSLNDFLKEARTEVSETLTDTPIRDLKKAIGINDRFLYINELFRGDEAMYERSIKTINSFSIWPEAEYWIRRELKTKLGWSDNHEAVKQFDQLVRRRFS